MAIRVIVACIGRGNVGVKKIKRRSAVQQTEKDQKTVDCESGGIVGDAAYKLVANAVGAGGVLGKSEINRVAF